MKTHRIIRSPLIAAFAMAALLGLCLPAAAYAAGKPDWVEENARAYPAKQWLTGRGVGSTAESAQDRARGDLAKVFEVRVKVETGNTTTVTKSGKRELVEEQASQMVSASTDKVINGIEIAEIWRDPVTQDYYALAVLSRSKAAAGLREEIERIDEEVAGEVKKAEAEADALLRLGALGRALETVVKRDGFEASLKIVSASGRGIDPAVSQAEVRARLADALRDVKISLVIAENGGLQEFDGVLKSGLSAAGLLAQSSGQAQYILTGSLRLNDLGFKQGWNWVRGNLEISLREVESGRVRGGKTWSLKAAGQDARTARARVLADADRALKRELKDVILGFAAQ